MCRLLGVLRCILAALAVLVLGAPTAGAAISGTENLLLDSRDPAGDGTSGPVGTTDVLASGRYYALVVVGNFTAFSPGLWSDPRGRTCGAPDPAPMSPSPGADPVPAGQDAETWYGAPWQRFCPALPRPYGGFQIDVGSGFGDRQSLDGELSAPRADHAYTYRVRGLGAAARFQIADTNTTDNNGVLAIDVRPAVKAECGGDAACEASAEDAPIPPPPVPPAASAASGPAPGAATPEAAAPGTSAAGAPAVCRSTLIKRLRLRGTRRDPVVAARVTVGRKRLKARKARGARGLVVKIDLRGTGPRTVRATIRMRTRSGKRRTSRRTFRVCGA